MEKEDIGAAFKKIEEEVNKGNLKAVEELKFWKLVDKVKKKRELAVEFAGIIGKIDSKLFDSKIKLKLGYTLGTAIELFGALIGMVILIYAVKTQQQVAESVSALLYLLSAIALMTALHPISHSIAGKVYGIKLNFYFLNGPLLIEPTLKVDYESYIKAGPKSRAMFHLAGAINSTVTTLFVFIVSLAFNASLLAKIVSFAWFAFTVLSEIIPIIFIKLGIKKILFADFRKSDSYRTLRELKYSE